MQGGRNLHSKTDASVVATVARVSRAMAVAEEGDGMLQAIRYRRGHLELLDQVGGIRVFCGVGLWCSPIPESVGFSVWFCEVLGFGFGILQIGANLFKMMCFSAQF